MVYAKYDIVVIMVCKERERERERERNIIQLFIIVTTKIHKI